MSDFKVAQFFGSIINVGVENSPAFFIVFNKINTLIKIPDIRNLESSILQLVECAKTYQHWAYEIKNSLEVTYSNGPIEGINNKIKALKRTTFGMSKFENFKARIMLLN